MKIKIVDQDASVQLFNDNSQPCLTEPPGSNYDQANILTKYAQETHDDCIDEKDELPFDLQNDFAPLTQSKNKSADLTAQMIKIRRQREREPELRSDNSEDRILTNFDAKLIEIQNRT